MEKVKEKNNNFFSKFKKSIGRFPITIGTIFFLMIVYILDINNDMLVSNISTFILIFASETFLIETLFREKFKNKIGYYILATIISGVLTYGKNIKGNFWGIEKDIFLFYLTSFITCLKITLINLGIYFNYKKSNKSFSEYATKTFISLVKTNLIYMIFAIGLAIITAIFVFLILGGKGYNLIIKIELLLIGIYYVPRIIYNIYDPNSEMGKFAKIVIKYVLESLIIISFAIIYMYIIKILILHSMPSNQIFRILTALFIMGLPIWTMCGAFNEEKTLDKINDKLPILFIPFILLQIYAIGVRIISNGFTISRYLCVMIVIFEIIYTIIYLKNKEHVGRTLIVFSVLSIISIIVPYINMYTVSAMSQCNNMRLYTRKNDLSDEDKRKIISGYNYLKRFDIGEKYITQEDRDYINMILQEQGEYLPADITRTEQLHAITKIDSVNIEGYKTLHKIREAQYTSTEDGKVILEIDGLKIDITNKMHEYLEHHTDIYLYFDSENEFEQDNVKIILTEIEITYDETKTISHFMIDGFLLEK